MLPQATPVKNEPREEDRQPEPWIVCPVCGGALIEVHATWRCSRCHMLSESCCEGRAS